MARRWLGRPTHAAQPEGDRRLDLDQVQHPRQLPVLVGQRTQLLFERREQYALQDAMELIQEAGNGTLHGGGDAFHFGVGLRNPILKSASVRERYGDFHVFAFSVSDFRFMIHQKFRSLHRLARR